MERPMEQNSEDRFSNLPNELVHHILAYLPMRALAQLSTLSKRCRELCISNPTLIFCSEDTSSVGLSRPGFREFLDRLMELRCLYKVKTQRFHLKWTFQATSNVEEHQVETWLQHAVNSSVEEVCLEIHDPVKSFSLPPFVLGCKSIRSLEIDTFELPSSLLVPSFADKLQVLELKNLKTNNESLGEWFSSFESLRKLKLSYIRGIKTITITNSSVATISILSSDVDLQKIDIQKVQKLDFLEITWKSASSKSVNISAPNLNILFINLDTENSHRTSLEISAPNLVVFKWLGNVVDNYCMKNFPNLRYASVGLLRTVESRANHASTKRNLEKVLHSIQRVEILNLWEDFVQVLYGHGCLPFLFGNIKELTIRETSSSAPSEPLFSLLRGTTNLEHLLLLKGSSFSEKSNYAMKPWRSLYHIFPNHLKIRAVKCFNGKEEVELIKHLFKNAEESEMVAILYTSPISQGVITEFGGFKFCPTDLRPYLTSSE